MNLAVRIREARGASPRPVFSNSTSSPLFALPTQLPSLSKLPFLHFHVSLSHFCVIPDIQVNVQKIYIRMNCLVFAAWGTGHTCERASWSSYTIYAHGAIRNRRCFEMIFPRMFGFSNAHDPDHPPPFHLLRSLPFLGHLLLCSSNKIKYSPSKLLIPVRQNIYSINPSTTFT